MTLLTKNAINKSLIELRDIIFNFSEWNDLLSLKIKEWGRHTLKIKNNDQISNVELAVDALFKNVLFTSLFTPVSDPILYDKHTWNRNEFDAYLDILQYLPFVTLKLNRKDAIDHTFANEILNWVKPFKSSPQQLIPYQTSSLVESLVPITFENGIIDYKETGRQLKIYHSFVAIAETQLENYTLAQTLYDMTAETKVARKKIEELNTLEEDRIKSQHELHHQTIAAGIDSIKQSQSLSQQIREGRLRDRQQDLQLTRQNIAKSERRNEARLDQITDLEKKIQSL